MRVAKGHWDWDRFIPYMVRKCDENDGRYCISIEEARKFKNGPVGKGFGIANFYNNVKDRYEQRYPRYVFSIIDNRRYLCCKYIGA